MPELIETEAPAPNVIEALRRVMRDLPAIGRTQRASEAQGGYAYRGIEQITQQLQPLLVKHGVVFVPEVVSTEIREITVNNRPWTDTVLSVRYTVYGPQPQMGTASDLIRVGPLTAIGRDNSDKGANKAMTQAFKYALLQVFCIADAADDADSQAHEADEWNDDADPTVTRRRPVPMPGFDTMKAQRAAHKEYEDLAAAQSDEIKEALKRWRTDEKYPYPMSREQLDAARAFLDLMISADVDLDEIAGGDRAQSLPAPAVTPAS